MIYSPLLLIPFNHSPFYSRERSRRAKATVDVNEKNAVLDILPTHMCPQSTPQATHTATKGLFSDTEVSPGSPYEFGMSIPLPKQHPDSFATWSEATFFFSVDIPSRVEKNPTITFRFEGQHLPMDISPQDI